MPQGARFLKSISLTDPRVANRDRFPYNLGVVQALRKPLIFESPVTIIVGENGTGKSTLLEAMAVACGLNAEGGSRNFDFATKLTHSPLHEDIEVGWGGAFPRDSFFLRAETFYNVASEIDRLDGIEGNAPLIRNFFGGKSLHEQSHGESFMALFLQRFGTSGLYILDEPEAALSPSRQITFLTRLYALAKEGSQFIIATHSPLILAFPDAKVIEILDDTFEEKPFEETLHFRMMRSLLKDPSHIRKLVEDYGSKHEEI